MADLNHIRNFCILAHVDHGKSTLADRLLEITHTVEARQMKPQYLDQMELERERGITIKMAPVRMEWNGYILNLIDTPGHSDFSYEVSRALAAVEGAILLVDATQGIQAQTFVNYERAKAAGLTIVGAVNKVDLYENNPEEIDMRVHELAKFLQIPPEGIFRVSGKTGAGVEELLRTVILKIPAPKKSMDRQALVFDSLYDDHKGVVAFVRVTGGRFKFGETVQLVAAREKFKIKEVGHFKPKLTAGSLLTEGEMGYIATGIKDPGILRIGDTVSDPNGSALEGYNPPRPVVFVSLYPEDADDYDTLRLALGRLKLNDSSLQFEPETNDVLGRGFRCGFLGQLHFEITTERLDKEFNLAVISTFPSVAYTIKRRDRMEVIHSAENIREFDEIREPVVRVRIVAPASYIGNILQLITKFRAHNILSEPFEEKILVTAVMPLMSLIEDFDGSLKSISSGMASMSYEMSGDQPADLERVEILVAGDPVPGLTRFMYRDELESESRKTLLKLKDLLPQQQFAQALQAQSNGRIIARETIAAMKKNLGDFGKNGGDRTRKMKLWKKQKRGKERLKEMGRVTIPPNLFKELLKK